MCAKRAVPFAPPDVCNGSTAAKRDKDRKCLLSFSDARFSGRRESKRGFADP